MTVKIVPATPDLHKQFRAKLFEIYFESSANDYHEQLLNREKESNHLNDLIQNTNCLFALEAENLTGFLFGKPFLQDCFLPGDIKKSFDIKRCFYVAELAIEKEYRHQGIGTQLIQSLLKKLDKRRYDNAFIATWTKNIPAMNLYQKLGFTPVGKTVEQEKIKKDQSGKFKIYKQYFWKKL